MNRFSMPMVARCICSVVLLLAVPAGGEILSNSNGQFTLGFSQEVKASPDAAWRAVKIPARWWSGAHSYSGDARNLSIDARAGGCFCERWSGNSVEHARVVRVEPGKILRMAGGLGPLQQAPVTGVLTIEISATLTGSKLRMTYAVAGDFPGSLTVLAPAVDAVLGEQFTRLTTLLER